MSRVLLDSAGRFVFTVRGTTPRQPIASELAWAMALRRDGAAITPVPHPGRDGELIQTFSHRSLPRPRNLVLFDWEEGTEPSEGNHALEKVFKILGETTARMHDHVRKGKKPDYFTRHSWNFETSLGSNPHWGSWRNGTGVNSEREVLFCRTVDVIARRLEHFGQAYERFGLIHCDMRLANLLIDGEVTKVIDFDDCGFSWLLYDCATTVSFFEHKPEVPALLDAWLAGYRRVMDLPAEDAAELPTFVMLRRLLLVAWIGSHSETELARSMGVSYTDGTVELCEEYLTKFG